jgi:hypothetical protein
MSNTLGQARATPGEGRVHVDGPVDIGMAKGRKYRTKLGSLWVTWHEDYGHVIFDPKVQKDVKKGMVALHVCVEGQTRLFDLDHVKGKLCTSKLRDPDAAVQRYVSAGPSASKPRETPRPRGRPRFSSGCFNCKSPLDAHDQICPTCKRAICPRCGACKCSR